MTESYLTTDIIVIVVLVVVLILIGVCAFCAHFYWTKIGVAEIWNTAKWSSMRSSFYRTARRLSRASSRFSTDRPFSAASAYSEDIDGSALPAPLRNPKPVTVIPNPQLNSSNIQSPPVVGNELKPSNNRQKSSNQVQPVSTVTYNKAARPNYGTKIGQPLENTRIHNVHENTDQYHDDTVTIENKRF